VGLVAVVATLLFVVSPASRADEPTAGARQGATLRVGTVLTGDVPDWLDCRDSGVREVWELTHEPLAGCSAEDCTPEPRFAESWSASPDARVWTFSIRSGLTWHDGEPADAYDAEFSYRRALRDDAPVLAGSLDGIERVVADDELTLRVVCSRPRADLLTLRVPIIPEHMWDTVDVGRARRDGPTPDLMVGTGPFQCVEWEPGEYARLAPSDGSSVGMPGVDDVLLLSFADKGEMVRGLRAGLLDAASAVPPGSIAGLGKAAALEVTEFPTTDWTYLALNCAAGHPALVDPAFRRALAWAVDGERLAKLVFNGRAQPGITAITGAGYGAAVRWTPAEGEAIGGDEEEAKRILDEAGFVDDDGDGIRECDGRPITLRLWAGAASSTDQKAGKLLATWFERLGLAIRLETLEEDDLRERLERTVDGVPAPDFDLLVAESTGAVDPGQTLERFTAAHIGTTNVSGWTDAEYERLAAEQQQETDPELRADLLRRMQEILYVECPQVALAYPTQAESFNVARWRGWVHTPSPDGPVVFGGYSIASYVELQRVVRTAAGSPSGRNGTVAVVAGVCVAVVAAVGGGMLYRRSRRASRDSRRDDGKD